MCIYYTYLNTRLGYFSVDNWRHTLTLFAYTHIHINHSFDDTLYFSLLLLLLLFHLSSSSSTSSSSTPCFVVSCSISQFAFYFWHTAAFYCLRSETIYCVVDGTRLRRELNANGRTKNKRRRWWWWTEIDWSIEPMRQGRWDVTNTKLLSSS